jgi:hypothetical protein
MPRVDNLFFELSASSCGIDDEVSGQENRIQRSAFAVAIARSQLFLPTACKSLRGWYDVKHETLVMLSSCSRKVHRHVARLPHHQQ